MNTTQSQNSTATAGGHTKGPLTLRPSSNPANGTLWRDIIAEGEFGPMYIGEALEPYALLFCQAPAMLEALKAFRVGCENGEQVGESFFSKLLDQVDKIVSQAEVSK